MPEEKYRTVIDHLSDVIYAYLPEYKEQGIREGINPANIIVVGNPIVDILNYYYFSRPEKYAEMRSGTFFEERGLSRERYYLMTCHRRENVGESSSLSAILRLVECAPYHVYFPASYRTQRQLKSPEIAIPANMTVVDPVGYEELLCLMVNSRGVLTDSGTVVEEACVLQVPCVQMRASTERPQVYDAGACVKFDPTRAADYPAPVIFAKLDGLWGRTWAHGLGDGKASERIAEDLHNRMVEGRFRGHRAQDRHIPIGRSYREDGLTLADR